MAQLPAGLKHLSIATVRNSDLHHTVFPTTALLQLLQLTCLELANIQLAGSGRVDPALQPLQALARLIDLRLSHTRCPPSAGIITLSLPAGVLSAAHHPTRLTLSDVSLEPGTLAGKTQMQHLQLVFCQLCGGAASVAELMSHLQPMQQLTHLDLFDTLPALGVEGGNIPASACSALTASSKLQSLTLYMGTLPAGVWQHVFPTGRQLPHLQQLVVSRIAQPDGRAAPAPEGSRIVSCCPNLQSLDFEDLRYSAELLAPLQGLSKLHKLQLDTCRHGGASQGLEAVSQLTGLRSLIMQVPYILDDLLGLQLTRLKHLTSLFYRGPPINQADSFTYVEAEVSWSYLGKST
jgi:hypothetical protein